MGLVSVPGSIDYRVEPAVRREDFVRQASPDKPVDWWQLAAINPR